MGLIANIAIFLFLLGFGILIVVGWVHGGKYQMSLSDPALKKRNFITW